MILSSTSTTRGCRTKSRVRASELLGLTGDLNLLSCLFWPDKWDFADPVFPDACPLLLWKGQLTPFLAWGFLLHPVFFP